MHILVINSGSSSIKFSLFDSGDGSPRLLFDGEVSGVGGGKAGFKFRDAQGRDVGSAKRLEEKAGSGLSSDDAIALVASAVCGEGMPEIEAVGYRVVHPGAKLDRHQRVTAKVLQELEAATAFAPLHDPAAIAMIQQMMQRFPKVEHYVCFDTVFHRTMPEEATAYPIPVEYRKRGVRRYGFHGLSCESIVRQLLDAAERGEMHFPRRLVIAHLGSGCSVTALEDGESVDTTMGLTPTGGVVMGTRPGDLDPGLVLYLLRQAEGDRDAAAGAVEKMLNHSAGMVALSGMPNDMKAVRDAAAKGDARASLAVEIFTRSVKKAVGGFLALLGGADAIVFAGGIGEHDAQSRAGILGGLENFGIVLDAEANNAKGDSVRRINASESKTAVFVIPTQEDLMIAVHVDSMARSEEPTKEFVTKLGAF
jgi:acetate kinase